jgi:hypothetical protein
MPHFTLNEACARLPTSYRPVEAALEVACLINWSTHLTPSPGRERQRPPSPGAASARELLSRVGTHPKLFHFRVQGGSHGQGILYETNRPAPPTTDGWEAFMGFTVGDTGAPGFSHNQRIHLLGQGTNLNAIFLTVATIRAHLVPTDIDTPIAFGSTHTRGGYIFYQPSPTLEDTSFFLVQRYIMPPSLQGDQSVRRIPVILILIPYNPVHKTALIARECRRQKTKPEHHYHRHSGR